ncbi:HNH endonuclease signature motif containing protein [Streptomyces sp. enrichment culture]|uniref:HNH endonuclease signature motif containing protein n=1 Tax=Streptomyces sp. enrichment culture TaxID=1795815 RepID=UPI003F5609D2
MIEAVNQETIARFWTKVNKAGDCWVWTSATDKDGYGRFSVQRRRVAAHRFSYLLAHGEIPDGFLVDHLCHGWDETCMASGNWCLHRRCVNPSHLEAVTPQVNQLRGRGASGMAAKRTHCPQGHPYDEENTHVRGRRRNCRACARARERKRDRSERLRVNLSVSVIRLLAQHYPEEAPNVVLERAVLSLAAADGLVADSEQS